MTVADLKVRKVGRVWEWCCWACFNIPGHTHETWNEAMMMGLDHTASWHPRVDWNSIFGGDQ